MYSFIYLSICLFVVVFMCAQGKGGRRVGVRRCLHAFLAEVSKQSPLISPDHQSVGSPTDSFEFKHSWDCALPAMSACATGKQGQGKGSV